MRWTSMPGSADSYQGLVLDLRQHQAETGSSRGTASSPQCRHQGHGHHPGDLVLNNAFLVLMRSRRLAEAQQDEQTFTLPGLVTKRCCMVWKIFSKALGADLAPFDAGVRSCATSCIWRGVASVLGLRLTRTPKNSAEAGTTAQDLLSRTASLLHGSCQGRGKTAAC